MTDAIKARFDISFQNPARTVRTAQDVMTLFQGIRTTPLQPKAIGMAIGQAFRNRIEGQQVQSLHRSVRYGGDAQSAPFAVALGNGHAAEWLRLVAVPAQRAEGVRS